MGPASRNRSGTASAQEWFQSDGFEPRIDPWAHRGTGGEGVDRWFGSAPPRKRIGAEDGIRTRDPHLGKVMLYQLSHFRSELRTPVLLVPRARVELATPRFSVACSTN